MIVFSGGMYVGKNTSHGASVELFAWGEQPRHRAQCSLFCQRSLLLWQAYLTFYDMHYIIKSEVLQRLCQVTAHCLHNALRHHCVGNLQEPGNVCAKHEIAGLAAFH